MRKQPFGLDGGSGLKRDLYGKMARLQWLFHRQGVRAHAKGGPMADPSRGQGRILSALKDSGPLSTKELSNALGMRASSLNEMLSKLEKGGFVAREPFEGDRRVTVNRLTQLGEGQEAPIQEGEDVFACLSEEEQAAFGEYMDRVAAALEEKTGSDSLKGAPWDRGMQERRHGIVQGEGEDPWRGRKPAGPEGRHGHWRGGGGRGEGGRSSGE
jgi:DNA-binding MarR family transcriptional regulator